LMISAACCSVMRLLVPIDSLLFEKRFYPILTLSLPLKGRERHETSVR
jgi:hypothetical protein